MWLQGSKVCVKMVGTMCSRQYSEEILRSIGDESFGVVPTACEKKSLFREAAEIAGRQEEAKAFRRVHRWSKLFLSILGEKP